MMTASSRSRSPTAGVKSFSTCDNVPDGLVWTVTNLHSLWATPSQWYRWVERPRARGTSRKLDRIVLRDNSSHHPEQDQYQLLQDEPRPRFCHTDESSLLSIRPVQTWGRLHMRGHMNSVLHSNNLLERYDKVCLGVPALWQLRAQ
ncbi:hypothetical protein KCU70_g21, partial [Aureobasidium melanogenum]